MISQALTMVLTPACLGLILLGVVIGIIFGCIPGLSSTMAVVLFLPLSFGMSAMNGISLLVGLYLGGISGGLISAILLKIPGTSASISTVFDGGPMAEKGEAGKALGCGILYSFLGGQISIFALMFLAPLLGKVVLAFTPVEYFAISVFSLTIIASLAGDSIINGLLGGLLGLALSCVGMAPLDAIPRFTFGKYQLMSGFNIVVILIGIYAVTDIIFAGLGRKMLSTRHKQAQFQLKGFGISLTEFVRQLPNMIRSSLIGIGIGILPGIGGSTAGLMAYTSAKNSSKYPEKFGTGVVDGVIASETANNAVIGGSLVPLITMGIPGNTVTAVFLGGLTIHGIAPGPLVFQKSGQYIYGIYIALIVANIFMILFERGFLRFFVKILDLPKFILFPLIMVCCVMGAFANNSRTFDIWCAIFFGLLGVLFKKLHITSTPLIIGFILGTMTETNLRRALQASAGDWSVFFTRPISAVFLVVAALSIILTLRRNLKKKPIIEDET